ncbi:carbonyl reductase [NADPH] 2 [Folsomia candida]|uniref:Carbonyl reductase [NADPH] 2 n=1 Tax=Folsomia candida TaxID=158441 RepID=A0A226EDR1_FOLCA|nr:carbonyl reductase [NADPH] 2 [Folsomia candida]OXA55662.1 Carbonyl reductase [NADPH] 2 [Folsomia candida]
MALHYSFSGKKVLVTGGGRGIGRAVVQKLYDDDAKIYILEKDAELIQQVQKELPKATAVCVDVCDWKATREAILKFGPLDHLVNNAGVLAPQEFMDLTEQVVELHMAVNFKAMINVTQSVAKGMIESGNGGSIVNMSSLAGHLTVPGICSYSCTKAAVIMLTKSMALELGKHKIRANSVSPTGAATIMATLLPEAAGAVIGRAVDPRPVLPEEIADTILFLLSPKAGMITGEDVTIDSGVRTC